MGTYVNPGSSGFEEVVRTKYIDKTGMIGLLNKRVGTKRKLVSVSRPRRFGKSYAAQMMCAYYDHTCDSHMLFDNLDIAATDDYERNMNQYNVIYLDMAAVVSDAVKNKRAISDVPMNIADMLRKELIAYCPDIKNPDSLDSCLIECVEITGMKFVFIIDEWDAIIREARQDEDAQRIYLNLLRELFKNNNLTPKVVALAYMTGILPIKKDGSQSAISDFKEYTMLSPGEFAEYTGFTEDEVRDLCREYGLDYERMKAWYDGYWYEGVGSIYNPYSVMEVVESSGFESHWQKTSVAENLITYINLDFDGLQADILKLIAEEPLKVNTRGFHNDFEHFHSKDDVLTLLIHLGYLAYDKKTERVRIPNEEVRIEFTDILGESRYTKLAFLVQMSEQLLADTLAGREQAVASAIEKVRETNYAPQYYNDEQALRYAVKFAYIVCVDRFMKIEELPSGRGLADLVFVPDRNTAYPAIIIELKWNKDVEKAIEQIDDRKYASLLEGYTGSLLKVAITYDTETKKHSCKIEKMTASIF